MPIPSPPSLTPPHVPGSSGFKALFGLSKKDLASDKELDANAIAALRHEAALCVQVGREVKRALSWLTTSLREAQDDDHHHSLQA